MCISGTSRVALEEEIPRGGNEHDEQEQHQRDGKQRLPLQAAGVGHFAGHARGEKAHALEQRGHVGRVACDHHHSHGLADGAADAQHDCRGDAALGRRNGYTEIGLHGRCAQREGSVLVFLGNGFERGDGDFDDGRQDHDGQHDDRCKQACAVGHMEDLADARHEDQHTHKAVDHGGNARQHAHGHLHGILHALGRELGQIHGSQKTDRYAEQNRTGRAVDACEQEGQNAEGRLGGSRIPDLSEQEGNQADLPDSRNARDDQIHRDKQHAGHGHKSQQEKDDMHQSFDKLFAFAFLIVHMVSFFEGISGS